MIPAQLTAACVCLWPCRLASAEGHDGVVRALLRVAAAEGGGTAVAESPLVDRRTEGGATALLAASRGGHAPAVRTLLGVGGAATEVGTVVVGAGGGYTALLLACGGGHAEVVEALLEGGADLEARLPSGLFKGYTTLGYASGKGHAATVAVLLAEAKRRWGADEARLCRFLDAGVTAGILRGATPLMSACGSNSLGGDPASVVRQLLDAGADPHAVVTSWLLRGFGALHEACHYGHSREVPVLLGRCLRARRFCSSVSHELAPQLS